jgi:hypothetical protein
MPRLRGHHHVETSWFDLEVLERRHHHRHTRIAGAPRGRDGGHLRARFDGQDVKAAAGCGFGRLPRPRAHLQHARTVHTAERGDLLKCRIRVARAATVVDLSDLTEPQPSRTKLDHAVRLPDPANTRRQRGASHLEQTPHRQVAGT